MPSSDLANFGDCTTVRPEFWLSGGTYVTLKDYIRQRLLEIGQDQIWLAQQLDISTPSLSQILNLKRDPSLKQLDTLANSLNVSSTVLLRLCGYGQNNRSITVPASGEIIGDGEVRIYDQTERATAPRVTAPTDIDTAQGFVVRTQAVGPRYLPNDVVWTEEPFSDNPNDWLAHTCVVRLADGRHLLRTPLLSTQPGRYTLLTPSGAIEPDREMAAASAIRRIITG